LRITPVDIYIQPLQFALFPLISQCSHRKTSLPLQVRRSTADILPTVIIVDIQIAERGHMKPDHGSSLVSTGDALACEIA
jgi:hypothetical protein